MQWPIHLLYEAHPPSHESTQRQSQEGLVLPCACSRARHKALCIVVTQRAEHPQEDLSTMNDEALLEQRLRLSSLEGQGPNCR